jgi:hypothetical protein
METLYLRITKNDVSQYKIICDKLITKTQVAKDYNTLRILFIANTSLLEVFQKQIILAIGGNFQGKLPLQAHAYASKQNRGTIAINTDNLKNKTLENSEFIILEEFCHLLDYAADDFTQSSQFLSFCNDYSKYVDSHFSSKISEQLDIHYNHYYVNKLLLFFDVEKWIQFKSNHYGPSSRSHLSRLFAEIRATKPAKHCLAIITVEILHALCFARSVESFLAYAKELSEEQKQQLIASENKAIETIQFAEQNARTLDKSYPNTMDYFRLGDFVSKDSFFIRVRQFWNYLHLFGA